MCNWLEAIYKMHCCNSFLVQKLWKNYTEVYIIFVYIWTYRSTFTSMWSNLHLQVNLRQIGQIGQILLHRCWGRSGSTLIAKTCVDFAVSHVNAFRHINDFWRLCSKLALKTLWRNENLLKTSNFSFCHSVINSFQW